MESYLTVALAAALTVLLVVIIPEHIRHKAKVKRILKEIETERETERVRIQTFLKIVTYAANKGLMASEEIASFIRTVFDFDEEESRNSETLAG